MEVIDTLYTVTLQDCPDEVPERARASRGTLCQSLEQALGGPEEVAAALDTMSGLEVLPTKIFRKGRPGTGSTLGQGLHRCEAGGFRDLGEAECMYFDVRLS